MSLVPNSPWAYCYPRGTPLVSTVVIYVGLGSYMVEMLINLVSYRVGNQTDQLVYIIVIAAFFFRFVPSRMSIFSGTCVKQADTVLLTYPLQFDQPALWKRNMIDYYSGVRMEPAACDCVLHWFISLRVSVCMCPSASLSACPVVIMRWWYVFDSCSRLLNRVQLYDWASVPK